MRTRFLRALKLAIGVTLVSNIAVSASEVWLKIEDTAFVPQVIPTGQNFEVLRFTLPDTPQGSRIDFATLVLNLQRDSVRDDYLFLKLVPITSDWTPTSLQGGQILSVDPMMPAYAVADIKRTDRIELDVTQLVSAWLNGQKTNRGFLLQTDIPEEQTKISVKSISGAKGELIIHFTAPETDKAVDSVEAK